MKIIGAFKILDHGVEHSQYFQGCGISHTPFTDVATGIGDTPGEALDDALEQLAQSDWDVETIERSEAAKPLRASTVEAHTDCEQECCDACSSALENGSCPTGCANFDQRAWHDDCELHYHVSVRVKAQTLGEYLDTCKAIKGTLYKVPQFWLDNDETINDPNWNHLEACALSEAHLYQIPYTVSGDYVGGSCERSNARVFLEQFPDAIKLYGDYGGQCVVLPLSYPVTSELIETLERLASYPLIDEDDLSQLEQDEITAEWNDYARRDFVRALAAAFREAENERAADWVEDMPEDAINDLYWRMCGWHTGKGVRESYPEHGGCEIVWNLEETVEKIGADDLPPFPPMPVNRTGCEAHKVPEFGCSGCKTVRDAFAPYMGAD